MPHKPTLLLRTLNGLMPHRISRPLRELYWSATLMQVAAAGLALFETIYLWTLGYDLQTIVLWWLIVYVLYFLWIPIGAKFARAFGYEKMIAIGAVFYVVYLCGLYSVERLPWMLFPAAVLLAMQKFLYWPAFHLDFAQNIDGHAEGMQVGGFQILSALAMVFGPIIGGVVVEYFGFAAFFVGASVVIVLSNWPMLRTKEPVHAASYAYDRPYRLLFSRGKRRDLLAYLGFGEELVGLAIWPIFVYVVVKDFLDSGLVIGFSTGVTALLTYFLARATDSSDRRSLLRGGVFAVASLWLVTAFFSLARWIPKIGVLVAAIDTSSRVGKSAIAIPMLAMTYEDAKHDDALDQVLVYEMGLILGKVLAALVIFVALFFVSGFTPFFVVAALMTLFYAFR